MLFPCTPSPLAPPRVVVTGVGVLTALGAGWRPNADGFRAGRTAFRPITLFDTSRQRVHTAAEVGCLPALPPGSLTPRQKPRVDRATRMLLSAVHEALDQAGWKTTSDVSMVLGTTSGGMSVGEDYFRRAMREPARRRGQPTRALHYQAQVQARLVADAIGSLAPFTLVANACASGANAIGLAWEALRRGRAQRILAGGYDALNLLVFSGFDSLQALSPTLCRPFDAHRDGLALGEGAAILALETLPSAQARRAPILGEILGYGSSTDLFHLTQPHPEGDAALQSMQAACQTAGLGPDDVDYVNAHGTGTLLNDSSEAKAINRWAGARASTLPVSSTKACIGHLLGAAGAVEAVVSLMVLRGQWLPPQVALQAPDPLCSFEVVRQPRDASLRVVLSNSFGFGGANATLIFGRWS